MIDYYTIFKKLIPRRVRNICKPVYLKWSLRSFKSPEYVKIKNYPFSLKIDPENGAIDHYVYMHRNWDVKIGAVLERELQPGNTFVDIGANIGYFSLLASTLVGSAGSVVAFEPISRISKQFVESVTYNNFHNISVKNIALGNHKAQLRLGIVPGNIGGSSLVKENTSGIYETVTVSTLDEELVGVKQVSLIKIDVEGYEHEVLLGAKHILMTHMPKLILEFSPNVYNKRDPSISRSILLLLREIGYSVYDIENDMYIEDIDKYLGKLGREQTNLFACAINKIPRQIAK